jgi:predicted AlkP superfamily phosphohydrolase/phosphomutase
MSPAAWSSFITGLQPGRHGIFYFLDRIPGTYRTRYVNATSRDGSPYWTALSLAGKRVASLFVPLTYPAVPVNGVLASGWLAPSLADPHYAFPADFPRRMLEVAPEFRLHSGMTEYVRRGRYRQVLDRKIASVGAKAKVAADLLGREDWDLFVVAFDETDPIQHYFWHFHDPRHPEYTPAGARAHGDGIFRIYQAADEAVGRLVALTGEETHVLVISDHGSGLNSRGQLYLRGLLRSYGLEVGAGGSGRGLAGLAARRAYDVLYRMLPSDTKHRLAARFRALHERLMHTSFAGDIDWSATRAYTFWSNGCSEPWINTRGRDPQGIVSPGPAYAETARQVAEIVMEARDAATGEPAAEGVVTREEVYHGPHIDRAPDLLVRWRTDLVVQGLRSPARGYESIEPVAEDLRTGSHVPQGLLVAAGPPADLGQAPLGACIADVAPTVYALLDIPPPHELDGRAWTELYPRVTPAHAAGDLVPALASGQASDEDALVIEKRLEALGYL